MSKTVSKVFCSIKREHLLAFQVGGLPCVEGNQVWQAGLADQLGTLQIPKTITSHQKRLCSDISELFEDSLMNPIRPPHRCLEI